MFDLPTAAGFHAARATERVLRRWCESATGLTKQHNHGSWEKCIKRLRDKYPEDDVVLGAVEQMSKLQRNPVIHPQVFLDDSDALLLMGQAQGCISGMVYRIRDLVGPSTEPEQPS